MKSYCWKPSRSKMSSFWNRTSWWWTCRGRKKWIDRTWKSSRRSRRLRVTTMKNSCMSRDNSIRSWVRIMKSWGRQWKRRRMKTTHLDRCISWSYKTYRCRRIPSCWNWSSRQWSTWPRMNNSFRIYRRRKNSASSSSNNTTRSI